MRDPGPREERTEPGAESLVDAKGRFTPTPRPWLLKGQAHRCLSSVLWSKLSVVA